MPHSYAMSLLAQVDFWDFFQNFCMVMGSATAVAVCALASYRTLKREQDEALEKLEKSFEEEMKSFKESHHILRVADAARIAKLEADYDEAIRLLQVSRMFVPGQPMPPPMPRKLPPKQ